MLMPVPKDEVFYIKRARCIAPGSFAFTFWTNLSLSESLYQTARLKNSSPMQTRQVKLRQTEKSDLPFLFQFQLDNEANHLAAFTPKDQPDEAAYIEKFTKFLQDSTINMRTILVEETIVGSIAKFEREGDAEITYWIDRNFWGQGIATTALKELLAIETTRPIFGGVAFDNIGSQKVLEKCGFVKVGTDKGFANARQTEVEEFIYKLT